MHSVEFGKAYAFTENPEYGQIYAYRFETKEFKRRFQDAATSRGRTYKGVAFRNL